MTAMNWLEQLMNRAGGSEGGRAHPQKIDGATLQHMRQEQPQMLLLDIRTPEEYRKKHIPGSLLMPLYTLSARQQELPDDLETPLAVYCLSGARSHQAARQLIDMGYRNVYDLGGISRWPYRFEVG